MFDWDIINSNEFDIVEDKICKEIPQLEKEEEEINNKKELFEKWKEFTKTQKLEIKYYKKWRDFVEKKIEKRQFLDIDSLEILNESNKPFLEVELNEKIDIEKDNNDKEEEEEEDEKKEEKEEEDTEKDSKKKKDYIVIEIRDEIIPKKRKREIKKLNKRLCKKRKINGNYSKRELIKGKEIFMMIKMDEWYEVHPEDLTNDIERKNVQKLFEFIWNEMQSSEKYAYVKYNAIDNKYRTAIENSILNTIGNWICNMWSNIENFFDDLICKRENSHTKKI
tara:strand:+ start:87 stop:923 length:837 start_codon:yes stop_codon:yes gene_type:complete